MSIRTITPLVAVSLLAVSGCGLLKGGGGGGGATVQQVPANSASVGLTDEPEAARADVSMNEAGQILLTVTSGPMKDTTFLCADANGGTCTVVAPADLDVSLGSGTLLHRIHGEYAFVGNFNVRQLSDSNGAGMSQLVHAPGLDGPTAPLSMPQGVASYTGRFHAGAGINSGPNLSNRADGLAQGTAVVLANFNSARLTVDLNGAMTETGEPIRAIFGGITIDPKTGHFTSPENALHEFQHEAAGGSLSGAFYGPGASEAAGLFNIGSERHGGMSGVFLACKGLTDECIKD